MSDARTTDVEAQQPRAQPAIDAAGIGGFDHDLVSGRLSWDERLIDLFGYAQEGFAGTIEAFFARLHPEDVDRTAEALQATPDHRGELDVEYRVVVPGGETRWVQGRGRVLVDTSGAPVRQLGAACDTTRQRRGDARVARVLETMSSSPLDDGIDRLLTIVSELAGQPLAALCDGVVARVRPGEHQDDVALVAVRLR